MTRHPRTNQAGFSLMELLIAMGIFTIGFVAVAAIFYMRYEIEEAAGKTATRQGRLAGFETEDVLYLFPLVTLAGVLPAFLKAAAIGAPAAALLVGLQYRRLRARPGR